MANVQPPQPVQPPPPPAPAPSGAQPLSEHDAHTMAMLAHLLGIVTGFIGALVIWLIMRERSEFVDDQGKEALNFQITVLFAWIAAVILAVVTCVGFVLLPLVWVGNLVLCLLTGLKANKGERARYPVAIRLIK
jgi:uncharacterized protein